MPDYEMVTPQDFELPPKFTRYREGQFEVSARSANMSEYGHLLDAPTGIGKTTIGATVQRLRGRKLIYICTTKQLQDQILADYPYARTIKGRSNYPCARFPSNFPEINAETCTSSYEHPCSVANKCAYVLARQRALDADLAVLNMQYYLSEVNYHGKFDGYDYVVVDECDTIESQLMNFIELTVNLKTLEAFKVQPPRYRTKFEAWIPWARESLKQVNARLKEIKIEKEDPWWLEDFKLLREEAKLKRFSSKLSFFADNVDKTWVWYPSDSSWTFKPVWVAKYGNWALWRHQAHVLGMSATILDKDQECRNTGMNLGGRKVSYTQLPSPFKKEIRPIEFLNVCEVTKKTMNLALPLIASTIEDLLEEHPDEKILIHTASYDIQQYIMKNVKSKRLISHNTYTRVEALDNYKHSKEPLVLVSPSMDRGVDLPYEQCRVIIIAKVPFLNLGDPQVSQRVYSSSDGDNWYAHKAISSIIQMCGRGVRSDDDYCKTYILDRKFADLYDEHKQMFPKWFADAIVW